MRVKKNYLLIIPLVLLILIALALFIAKDRLSIVTTQKQVISKPSPTVGVQKNAKIENTLVVYDQRPGEKVLVGDVRLDESGYVVVYTDSGTGPGEIIGASGILRKGAQTNVAVSLDRAMRNGETLYAVLHKGDGGKFNPDTDKPLLNKQGGQIMAVFIADSEAPTNIEVAPTQ